MNGVLSFTPEILDIRTNHLAQLTAMAGIEAGNGADEISSGAIAPRPRRQGPRGRTLVPAIQICAEILDSRIHEKCHHGGLGSNALRDSQRGNHVGP